MERLELLERLEPDSINVAQDTFPLAGRFEPLCRNHRHAFDFHHQGRVGEPHNPDQCAGREVGSKIFGSAHRLRGDTPQRQL